MAAGAASVTIQAARPRALYAARNKYTARIGVSSTAWYAVNPASAPAAAEPASASIELVIHGAHEQRDGRHPERQEGKIGFERVPVHHEGRNGEEQQRGKERPLAESAGQRPHRQRGDHGKQCVRQVKRNLAHVAEAPPAGSPGSTSSGGRADARACPPCRPGTCSGCPRDAADRSARVRRRRGSKRRRPEWAG